MLSSSSSGIPGPPGGLRAPTVARPGTSNSPPPGQPTAEPMTVAVRVRPLSKAELKAKATAVWKAAKGNAIQLDRPNGSLFKFDHVYDGTVQNATVFADLAEPVLKAVLRGVDGTIFCYGQTSTGKTHTMQGIREDMGLIPRALEALLALPGTDSTRTYSFTLSYYEVYNEAVRDLLNPAGSGAAGSSLSTSSLQLFDDPESKQVRIKDLTELPITKFKRTLSVINKAEQHRATGATDINKNSSRSHTFLVMVVTSRAVANANDVRSAKLTFVDLAGSESAEVSRAKGAQLHEGGHINKSLLALKTVIHKLAQPAGRREQVLFRESKLTRLLQASLCGHARTAMICTVTPASTHLEITRKAIQLASTARRIQGAPVPTSIPVPAPAPTLGSTVPVGSSLPMPPASLAPAPTSATAAAVPANSSPAPSPASSSQLPAPSSQPSGLLFAKSVSPASSLPSSLPAPSLSLPPSSLPASSPAVTASLATSPAPAGADDSNVTLPLADTATTPFIPATLPEPTPSQPEPSTQAQAQFDPSTQCSVEDLQDMITARLSPILGATAPGSLKRARSTSADATADVTSTSTTPANSDARPTKRPRLEAYLDTIADQIAAVTHARDEHLADAQRLSGEIAAANARVAQLEADLDGKGRDLESVRAELIAAREGAVAQANALAAARAEVEAERVSVSELEAQLVAKRDTLEKVEAELAVLTARVADAEARIAAGEAATAESAARERDAAVAELQAKLVAAETAAKDALARRDETVAELDAVRAQLAAHEAQVTELQAATARVAELEQRIAEHDQRTAAAATSADVEMADATRDAADLAAALTNAAQLRAYAYHLDRVLLSREQEFISAQARTDRLAADLIAAQRERDTLASNLATARSQYAQEVAARNAVLELHAALATQHAALQADLHALRRDRDEAVRKLEAAEREGVEMRARLAEVEAEIARLVAAAAAATADEAMQVDSAVDDAQTLIDAARAERDEVAALLETERAAVRAKVQELEVIQAQAAQHAAELVQVQDVLAAKEAVAADAANRAAGLEESLASTRNALTAAEATAAERAAQLEALQAQVQATRDEAVAKADALATVQNQVDGLTATIAELTAQAQQDAAARTELEMQLAQLQADLTAATRAKTALEADLALTSSTEADIHAVARQRSQELVALQTEIDTLRSTLDGKQSELVDLQSQLDAARAETSDLQSRFAQGVDLYAQLKDAKTAADAEIEQLQDTLTDMDAERAELQRTLAAARDDAHAAHLRAETELDRLRDRELDLVEQCRTRDDELEQVREAVARVQAEVDARQASVDELTAQVAAGTERLAAEEKMVAVLEQAKVELEQALAAAQAAADELRAQLSVMEEAMAVERAARTDADAMVADLERVRAGLEAEQATLQATIAQLQTEQTTAAETVATATQQIAGLNDELASLTSTKGELETRLVHALAAAASEAPHAARAAELEGELEVLKRDLVGASADIGELTAALEEATHDAEAKLAQIVTLQESLAATQTAAAAREADLERATAELGELRAAHAALVEQLNQKVAQAEVDLAALEAAHVAAMDQLRADLDQARHAEVDAVTAQLQSCQQFIEELEAGVQEKLEADTAKDADIAAERQALEAQLHDAMAQLDRVQADLRDAVAARDALLERTAQDDAQRAQQLAEAHDRVTGLERDLAQAQVEARSVRAELDEAAKSQQETRDALTALQEQLASVQADRNQVAEMLSSQLNEAKLTARDYQDTVAEMQQRVDDLQQQLANERNTHVADAAAARQAAIEHQAHMGALKDQLAAKDQDLFNMSVEMEVLRTKLRGLEAQNAADAVARVARERTPSASVRIASPVVTRRTSSSTLSAAAPSPALSRVSMGRVSIPNTPVPLALRNPTAAAAMAATSDGLASRPTATPGIKFSGPSISKPLGAVPVKTAAEPLRKPEGQPGKQHKYVKQVKDVKQECNNQ